jgi:predicted RNA-binding protein with PUA-like domain
VDVEHVRTFRQVLGLGLLKQQAALEELPLVHKGSRLSVMPVSAEQWAAILALS